MGKMIPHACDVHPRDVRFAIQELRADPLDSLTDLDQTKPDGIEYETVVECSTTHVV
jgi:hypothetical protein